MMEEPDSRVDNFGKASMKTFMCLFSFAEEEGKMESNQSKAQPAIPPRPSKDLILIRCSESTKRKITWGTSRMLDFCPWQASHMESLPGVGPLLSCHTVLQNTVKAPESFPFWIPGSACHNFLWWDYCKSGVQPFGSDLVQAHQYFLNSLFQSLTFKKCFAFCAEW